MHSSSKEKKDEHEVELLDFLGSFTIQPQIFEKYTTRFFNVGPSELHKPAGMIIPKLPIYHPYHPFKNTLGDDIFQVPLAMILPNAELKLVPSKLMNCLSKIDIAIPVVPYFVAQTLPYDVDTEVIPRYQYALFPDAKGEMKGFESIHAQSIVYERDEEIASFPSTQIKIYESDKNKYSPTILCGDSKLVLTSGDSEMVCTVRTLQGRCIWSLVLGSHMGALNGDFLTSISHAFVGCTYFIPDNDAYQSFLGWTRDKSPNDVMKVLSDFIYDKKRDKTYPYHSLPTTK
jgi:hypothetical protein